MKETYIEWAKFKETVIPLKFPLFSAQTSLGLRVTAYDGGVSWVSVLNGTDLDDFNTNYASSANQPGAQYQQPIQTLSSNVFLLQADAVMAEVPAGSTLGYNIDFKVQPHAEGVGSLWLAGCEYWATGATTGDWCEFQIVDVDNLLGLGVGYVVKQYVLKRYVCNDHVHIISANSPGQIPTGLYLRVVYHSMGTTNPMLMVNYDLNTKD